MSNADAVGALPGGGPFLALWRQVDGDPGAVGDLASSFTTAASELTSAQRGVTAAAAGVGDGWTGAAADAFTAYLGRVDAAGRHVDSGLTSVARALHQAATAILETRSKVDAVAGRILDDVAAVQARAIDPDDPHAAAAEAQRTAQIERIVAQGCTDVQPEVEALGSALGRLAGGLATDVSSGGYVALAPPGDGSYLPPRGGPIAWQAVPKDGDHTAPAAAGGGGGGGAPGGAAGFTGAGGTGGSGATSGGPPAAQPTGDVKTWIEQATAILEQHGVPASKISAADINTIIQHESSGNPHAQNNTDSNAAAGHPSKGLMQTIDSTFDAYALPGHHDIWNPVDNIIAGVRYALSRYGSLDNVPGIRAVHEGGSYVGY